MDIVKYKSSHSGRRYKGGALILVAVIVAVLMISGTTLLFMSYLSSVRAIRMGEETACRVLTDAGLTKAIGTLNAQYRDGTLDDYALPMSVGETVQGMTGTFSYKVAKEANDVYVVTSVGKQGDFRRVEVAKLELQAKSYFDNAILTKGKLSLGGKISGYNPDDPNASPGTYPVAMGTLGTDSKSIVSVSDTVYGDVFCGVGADTSELIACDDVTGSIYALTEEPDPAIVTPVMPEGLTSYGPYTVSGSTVTFTPSDSGLYDNLAVSAGGGNPGILIIDGGTVTIGINNLLQLGVNCEIRVNEGSTLLLYIEDSISSMNGASISYSSETIDPSHIQIYGTGPAGSTFALKSKDVFQGIVYAPNALVSIQNASEIVGAVVADTFSSGSDFLYDTSLATATNIALSESHYEVNRWSESVTSEIPAWAQ